MCDCVGPAIFLSNESTTIKDEERKMDRNIREVDWLSVSTDSSSSSEAAEIARENLSDSRNWTPVARTRDLELAQVTGTVRNRAGLLAQRDRQGEREAV
ncbi:hypothetical protein PoB_000279000 [Plakobranchus ocellatus]|uniref:Uncharacterized protein n=1 Tax=Plakobranchus ocellatus TaxID=259542 RepID=A0AAV3Y0Q5_9GAST|nr:hypothetical protein PoB_000279000 [Plakobranchus ocellatus]